MNTLLKTSKPGSIFFFELVALGPLLLLSSRFVYALTLSLILIVHISFILFVLFISKKFLEKSARFSIELLLAATFIAIIDILMTVYLPLIRADMGILLPFIFFQGQFFLSVIILPEKSGLMSKHHIISVYKELFYYIVMVLILALLRELLTYGKISFMSQPWAGEDRQYFISIFSSVIGLLFLFTTAHRWIKTHNSKVL